ncbi:MAG TPA: HAMP domain-containing sensor histidine kinase, partial [Verrucomicrobiae bacterium]|nr:HAMP domain-containing sensor histidine kinase [Verrucomicrobiae bacterium]
PERARRGRLITRFAVLGSLFGFIYAAFYLLIGHKWGATIIVICSLSVMVMPFLMRWKKSAELAGNFLALILTLGFTGLCCVEGGLHGHAIAWLVSVPLCAMLLAGRKSAQWWAVIAFFAAGAIAGLDLAGIKLPVKYRPEWNSVVASAGYLGLILFMFILGLIFEGGRMRAFSKMRDALGELAGSNERLVHLNNEKNEFLGIAAHDLKNPLMVIVGNAELVKLTKDPGGIEKFASTIITAATRMSDLVNNLLNANAIEQGKFVSNLERCDLRALVEQSVEHNQTAATKKGITIKMGASDGLWARADRAATMQILDNLISNAVKYSPPNTTVQVHTLPEAEYIVVSVRDEGPGISEADQKKLFQKFTRLTARPTGGESSTGLGLSIVKRLAEAMSGTVQCHSAIGFGATFTLRLPVCPAEIPAPEVVPIKTRATTPFPGSTDIHSRN